MSASANGHLARYEYDLICDQGTPTIHVFGHYSFDTQYAREELSFYVHTGGDPAIGEDRRRNFISRDWICSYDPWDALSPAPCALWRTDRYDGQNGPYEFIVPHFDIVERAQLFSTEYLDQEQRLVLVEANLQAVILAAKQAEAAREAARRAAAAKQAAIHAAAFTTSTTLAGSGAAAYLSSDPATSTTLAGSGTTAASVSGSTPANEATSITATGSGSTAASVSGSTPANEATSITATGSGSTAASVLGSTPANEATSITATGSASTAASVFGSTPPATPTPSAAAPASARVGIASNDPSTVPAWPQLSTSSAQGEAVKSLQYLLQQCGATALSADGKFGPETNAAVRAFQKAQGLAADGTVGQQTWEALVMPPMQQDMSMPQGMPMQPCMPMPQGMPMQLMQQGSTGPAVKAVQSQLKLRGLLPPAFPVDGVFGPSGGPTDTAVRAYQQAHPLLMVDGQVSPQTWKSLLAGS